MARAWRGLAEPRIEERLAALAGSLRRSARLERIEIYHRASAALRVGRGKRLDGGEVRFGVEDGVAVRLRARGESAVRFAAASGAAEEAIEALVRRSLEATAGRPSAPDVWSDAAGVVRDHDPVEEPPAVEELGRWLDEGLAATPPGVDQAWIEVARTVERWILDGRPVASRERTRVWGLAVPARPEGEQASPAPALLAARGRAGWSAERWAEACRPRRPIEAGPARPLPPRSTVLFDPEPAAELALALVRALHTGLAGGAEAVGPGWRVRDLPADPSALAGGAFDDVGCPAAPLVLADGATAVGRLAGAGHFRRPSFRDAPRELPSHLVVDPPERADAARALRVERLTIHPLPGGEWALELEGPVHSGLFVRMTPDELVRRCAAGHGAPVRSYRGVETPALLFEDLPVSR